MKCPKCGYELTEGHLYCENCGEEIQIVPDFEPEIENSIIETLSTVAVEIGLEQHDEGADHGAEAAKATASLAAAVKPAAAAKTASLKHQEDFEDKHVKSSTVISIVIFIGILVTALVIGIQMYQKYSLAYQISSASEYAEAENYRKAILYLQRANELSPYNAAILYLIAAYYYTEGEDQKAVETLLPITQSDKYTIEEKEKGYEKIIIIYSNNKDYQAINNLLEDCRDNTIVTQFQQYMAMAPEFSFPEGSYAEVIPLKLSANTSGTIYYTLDGSRVTENSRIYTAPIFLETGDYVVSALFINDYGISSEIVSHAYHIDLMVPAAPEVTLYSGLYVEPAMIEVVLPETGTVHYTADGTDPAADSSRYTQPIPMPIGKTMFKFVTISDEGVASEIVNRNYEFRLQTNVTPEMAVSNVMRALLNRHVLTDMEGSAFGMKGKYQYKYDSIIEIPQRGYYYLITEYYEEANGIKAKTDHLYAVEVYTGAPNRLIYDEQNQMDLISLE